MDASELLKKENIYKLVALGAVLLFLLSNYEGGAMGKVVSNADNTTGLQGYAEGEIIANATIIGYDPYIITNSSTPIPGIGNLSDTDGEVETAQGYVVSLKSGASITGVYAYLRSVNVSGKANALFLLRAGAVLETGNGTMELGSGYISDRIEPIFSEGENVTIQAYVGAKDGKLAGTLPGSVVIEAMPAQLERNATVAALMGTKTKITIPWENRYDVFSQLPNITLKYGKGNVLYAKGDYVVAKGWKGNLSYVTGIAGDSIYVGNYTNRSQVEQDIGNATFPDAILSINGNMENDSSFDAFGTERNYTYSMMIKDGDNVFFASLTSATLYAKNQSVPVLVSGYVIKDRISSVNAITEMK